MLRENLKKQLTPHLQSEGHKLKANVTEKERQRFYNEVIGNSYMIRAEEIEFIANTNTLF